MKWVIVIVDLFSGRQWPVCIRGIWTTQWCTNGTDGNEQTNSSWPGIYLKSNAVITITIRLLSDYDLYPTTTYCTCLLPFDAIRHEQKMNMSIFRRSRIAVESNAYRNFRHFRRSRMRRGIVVSWSNRNCGIGLSCYSCSITEALLSWIPVSVECQKSVLSCCAIIVLGLL